MRLAASVWTALMRHSEPQLYPYGYNRRIGESLGNGTFSRLRGSDTRTVRPVSASMLT